MPHLRHSPLTWGSTQRLRSPFNGSLLCWDPWPYGPCDQDPQTRVLTNPLLRLEPESLKFNQMNSWSEEIRHQKLRMNRVELWGTVHCYDKHEGIYSNLRTPATPLLPESPRLTSRGVRVERRDVLGEPPVPIFIHPKSIPQELRFPARFLINSDLLGAPHLSHSQAVLWGSTRALHRLSLTNLADFAHAKKTGWLFGGSRDPAELVKWDHC